MRLYNAASCTPCSSTSEKPKQQSFVPATMTNNSTPNKNSEETPISLGGCGPEISKTDEDSNSNSNSNTSHRRDDQPGPPLGHRLGITKASSQQLQKPSHPKFQYLSKIPSTTSTTGEDTPPHDNTSSPTEYNGKTYIEADENKEEDLDLPEKIHRGVAASIQIDLKRNLRTQQTHQQAIRPLFGASDHCIKGRDYYYDKYAPQKTNKLALGNHHEDATVDNDAQSSCSTLTTTRSMLLQQDECAITVSSLSVAKKETCDVGVAKAFPCRETGLAKREKPIRMGAKGNGREIANKNDNRKESSPPISLVSTGASSKSAPNPPEEAAEWNDESTKYRDVNIQSRGGRTPTQRPALAGRADSLNLDPKEMVGTTKESKAPLQYHWVPFPLVAHFGVFPVLFKRRVYTNPASSGPCCSWTNRVPKGGWKSTRAAGSSCAMDNSKTSPAAPRTEGKTAAALLSHAVLAELRMGSVVLALEMTTRVAHAGWYPGRSQSKISSLVSRPLAIGL